MMDTSCQLLCEMAWAQQDYSIAFMSNGDGAINSASEPSSYHNMAVLVDYPRLVMHLSQGNDSVSGQACSPEYQELGFLRSFELGPAGNV